MERSVFLVAALAILAPFAAAHSPARPVTACQDPAEGRYHEYVPPVHGLLITGEDGNVSDCRHSDLVSGFSLYYPHEPECGWLGGTPGVCEPVTVPIDRPVLDYDGEWDYAQGGAWLFVVTGDGAASGVAACFGAPSVGHHGGDVLAWDDAGFGPRILLTSDHSPRGEEDLPDCGDNIVEPCDLTPPEPSDAPEPLNVVFDTYNALMYSRISPQGMFCNPLDHVVETAATLDGPTRLSPPFGPGADGTYNVFVLPDFDRGLLPQSGHVWTTE